MFLVSAMDCHRVSLECELEEVETHTNSVYEMVKENDRTEPVTTGECKPTSERVVSVHNSLNSQLPPVINKAVSRYSKAFLVLF